MIKWLKNSLIARGGVAMASITLIAMLNIFASVLVADRAQGDAAAINIAGSLRMHAMRLGYLLQKPETDVSLLQLQQQAAVISSKLHSNDLAYVLQFHDNDTASELYSQIVATWHNQIEPAFYDSSLTRSTLTTFYDSYLESIVKNADSLVLRLQVDSEIKIRSLLGIQGASMALTVIVILIAMFKLNSSIVLPLRKLLTAAERIRSGDFTVTLAPEQADELGQLADTFNQMSQELNRMYTDLEQKVETKTAELLRSNQALHLMYNAARKLSVSTFSTTTLEEIARDLERTTGVRHISICLDDNSLQKNMTPIIMHDREQVEHCQNSQCEDCYMNSVRQVNFGMNLSHPAFPIRINRTQYGVLFVNPQANQILAPWQNDLFNAISDTIATALSLEKKAENESRLMLAEERAAMARDLHDSLAQSLSYLKFQIGRWKILQSKDATPQQLDEVVEDIREGLNGAYKQLRELLTTFRLQISDPGLEPALRGTVAEFSQRGDLDIQLDYGLREIKLTPNEEIHLLQIIREALSNILKHAKAHQVLICLSHDASGRIRVCIDDDGIGLPTYTHKQHHYGLSIMQERASYLNSELQLSTSTMGGTRVCLEYQHEASTPHSAMVNYV